MLHWYQFVLENGPLIVSVERICAGNVIGWGVIYASRVVVQNDAVGAILNTLGTKIVIWRFVLNMNVYYHNIFLCNVNAPSAIQ